MKRISKPRITPASITPRDLTKVSGGAGKADIVDHIADSLPLPPPPSK